VRVRWTRRALADLEAQRAHIAADNPYRAERMGERALTLIEALAEFPYRGRSGRVSGTREFVLPGLPWTAIYEIGEDVVVVLRLLHQRQAWPPRQT
jgi:toxin ParE1/3/4